MAGLRSAAKLRKSKMKIPLCIYLALFLVFLSFHRWNRTFGQLISRMISQVSSKKVDNSTFHPIWNSARLEERRNHMCETKLPSSKQLRTYPFNQWRVSRFMAYFNVYIFLYQYLPRVVPNSKAKVLDIGGSAFLKPFNESIDITFTKNPGTDIHDTKFPSSTFDIVATDMVLEHLVNPQLAMLEIHRVLKPDGLAIITTVSYNPLHEESHYHDMWRFLPDGLKLLSAPYDGGIKLCGSWGSKEFIRIRSAYGIFSRWERQMFAEKRDVLLTSNDLRNPVILWMVVQK